MRNVGGQTGGHRAPFIRDDIPYRASPKDCPRRPAGVAARSEGGTLSEPDGHRVCNQSRILWTDTRLKANFAYLMYGRGDGSPHLVDHSQ
jgi:hypothetical protein